MVARDFPRSIGTLSGGMCHFTFEDIANDLRNLTSHEQEEIAERSSRGCPQGFQIWGLPSPASQVLKSMTCSDRLLLLESDRFSYIGVVIHRVSELCYELSRSIWRESAFPVIVLLKGELIQYPWETFLKDFDFDSNYHMRGNTAKLADGRFKASRFTSEDAFHAYVRESRALVSELKSR
jgi:hypothetical protein